jgi:hypothetical protein
MGTLSRRHSRRRFRDALPGSDQFTDAGGHGVQITPLRFERLRPGRRHRAVSRHHAFGRDRGKRVDRFQPPENAAVKGRNMLEKDKIAGEQGAGRFV